MPYNFSTKKSYADAFQKQNRTRAHAVVYVTAEIFKKGKKKTNMPLPKFSLQFAFSWSVYFSNRTESYSSQIEFAGPHGITENQTTYLHCGGEARAKKRARPPATCRKASRGKTGADTGPRDVDRLRSSHLETQQLLDEPAHVKRVTLASEVNFEILMEVDSLIITE